MASMAERTWAVVGPTVRSLLEKHQEYDFVVTGHSLGAGCACLLHILYHHEQQQQQQMQQQQKIWTKNNIVQSVSNAQPSLLEQQQQQQQEKEFQTTTTVNDRRVRCFAYASPPVFTPINTISKSILDNTINYIHQNDFIPHLSIDSVRRLCYNLQQLEKQKKSDNKINFWKRIKIISGIQSPPLKLMTSILGSEPILDPKIGAPRLMIPASTIVWLTTSSSSPSASASLSSSSSSSSSSSTTTTTTTTTKNSNTITEYNDINDNMNNMLKETANNNNNNENTTNDTTTNNEEIYTAEEWDPQQLAKYGIRIHYEMLLDHFPPRYEHAFESMIRQEQEEEKKEQQ